MVKLPIKTPENKNIYFEIMENGEMPVSPKPKAMRWTEESVQGTRTTIESETKLPNRNPQEPLNGTESCSGNFTQEFAPDESDDFLSAVLCSDWTEEKQQARLFVTKGASGDDSATISVGTAKSVTVALTSAEDTPAKVAANIAETEFTGYTVKVNPFNPCEVIFDDAGSEMTMTCSVDWGTTGAEGKISNVQKVKTLTSGALSKFFYMLREFTQEPKKYQLFRRIQFNQATISFELGSIVTMSFELMGMNNPKLENDTPVPLDSKVEALKTTPFTTLDGFLIVGGEQNIDATSFEITINNNSTSVYSLFEKEARESTLGKLDITGTLTEFFTDGDSYNRAIDGDKTPVQICVTGIDKTGKAVKYLFELMVKFTSPTEDMSDQITHSLPFQTFGEGRIMVSKITEA